MKRKMFVVFSRMLGLDSF